MSVKTMTSSDPASPEPSESVASNSGEERSPELIPVSNGQIYLAGMICCWIAAAVVLTIIYKAATSLDFGTGWF